MVLKFSPKSEHLSDFRATLTVKDPTNPIAVEFVVVENEFSENRTVASGYVKWDGCIELDMKWHMCHIHQVLGLGEFLTEIYIRAGELMGPKADIDAFNLVEKS
jgi:hypothetical protein